MFQPWRIQLRRAEEALAAQRLDEACTLVRQGDLPEYLPGKKLMTRLASQFVRRGRRHAELGQSLAGWRDLEVAAELGATVETLGPLREQLIRQALAETERLLAASQAEAAIDRLQALQRRGCGTAEVRRWLHVAGRIQSAERLARQADFAGADAELAGAEQLRPEWSFVAQRRDELRKKEIAFRALRADLHDALAAQRWSEVVNLAERLLELAPRDDVARQARAKAWAAAGIELAGGEPATAAAFAETQAPSTSKPEVRSPTPVASPMTTVTPEPGKRFILWIDGVGGYLVCEGDEVLLGQAVSASQVDIPILGDVSRDHAIIRRSGEGYLLVPRRTTKLNGREITAATPLAEGAVLELGQGVRLRFRQPHPLSRTVRLEFASRHRTQPSTDGVLLLAESCILGPGARCHVICNDWNREVMLCRTGEELSCRVDGVVEIDGKTCPGGGAVTRGSKLLGEDFSITMERL
jgi:hypothetical protein